jgi:hypothetical protein
MGKTLCGPMVAKTGRFSLMFNNRDCGGPAHMGSWGHADEHFSILRDREALRNEL